ncbi:MAG: phage integrase N-terminal domain-containing protein [Candidatus Nitrospinota bacterium M3_3B_026]
MHNVKFQVQQIIKQNPPRSYATRRAREVSLHKFAGWLIRNYPSLRKINSLKPKMINAYVQHLKSRNLSTGTLKNNISHLRFLARSIDKANIIPRTNAEFGIGPRRYASPESRAREIPPGSLERLPEGHRLGVELQRAFGLRTSEVGKFRVAVADRGTHLSMVGSWCKNARPRSIDIRNGSQRALLERLRGYLVRNGQSNLIPTSKSYRQWERSYYRAIAANLGVVRGHNLRHAFAAQLYTERTRGLRPPNQGGPLLREMDTETRVRARDAYQIVASELGHSRATISKSYLGGLG